MKTRARTTDSEQASQGWYSKDYIQTSVDESRSMIVPEGNLLRVLHHHRRQYPCTLVRNGVAAGVDVFDSDGG